LCAGGSGVGAGQARRRARQTDAGIAVVIDCGGNGGGVEAGGTSSNTSLYTAIGVQAIASHAKKASSCIHTGVAASRTR
jgi:hypothetical protein